MLSASFCLASFSWTLLWVWKAHWCTLAALTCSMHICGYVCHYFGFSSASSLLLPSVFSPCLHQQTNTHTHTYLRPPCPVFSVLVLASAPITWWLRQQGPKWVVAPNRHVCNRSPCGREGRGGGGGEGAEREMKRTMLAD